MIIDLFLLRLAQGLFISTLSLFMLTGRRIAYINPHRRHQRWCTLFKPMRMQIFGLLAISSRIYALCGVLLQVLTMQWCTNMDKYEVWEDDILVIQCLFSAMTLQLCKNCPSQVNRHKCYWVFPPVNRRLPIKYIDILLPQLGRLPVSSSIFTTSTQGNHLFCHASYDHR